MNAPVSLSLKLRTATKALHTQAERSGLMGALLKGRATRPGYAALLVALEAIYLALEEGLAAQAKDPLLGPLVIPGFARAHALSADLASLARHGVSIPGVAAEARRYAEHLRQLSVSDPTRLLAHAWLRYLGDLNGGQIVGSIVRASLALPQDATRFYEFPALADPMAAAGAWRRALDNAPFDATTQVDLVEEACDGFRRHIALFEALALAPSAGTHDAADSSSTA